MSKITIEIIKSDDKISKKITESISDKKGYKYTYLKQLISRLRMIKQQIEELSEEEQIAIFSNVLITESNIANYAAEQWADLNHEQLFNDLTEIADEIKSFLNEEE